MALAGGDGGERPGADPDEVKTRLDELHEQLASGVVDAEEQVSYVDPDEAAAVKPAGITLAALVATRDAVRRCYAMEIDPRYVDVAVLRWQALTGKVAVLAHEDRVFDDVAVLRGVAAAA